MAAAPSRPCARALRSRVNPPLPAFAGHVCASVRSDAPPFFGQVPAIVFLASGPSGSSSRNSRFLTRGWRLPRLLHEGPFPLNLIVHSLNIAMHFVRGARVEAWQPVARGAGSRRRAVHTGYTVRMRIARAWRSPGGRVGPRAFGCKKVPGEESHLGSWWRRDPLSAGGLRGTRFPSS